MSLMHSLLRWVDIVEFRKIEQERRSQREQLPDDGDPDLIETDPPAPARPALRRRCRLCGYEGESKFCLRCLAETMEPVSPGRRS